MAGKTDYGKVNADIEKRKEAKERRGKFSEVSWMSIPFGDTNLGMLPPFSDDHELYHEVYVHFGFRDSKDNKRSYLCSRTLHGECPICEQSEKLKETEPKRSGEIKGVKQFLWNGYNSEFANRVITFKPSQHNEVLQELNTLHIDEGVDATDPAEGKILKLSRMKVTPYARARILGKVQTLPEGKAAQLLEGMTDLTKAYTDNTPQELYKMLQGEDINVREEKSSETSGESTESTESTEAKASATTSSNGNGATATARKPKTETPAPKSEPAPDPSPVHEKAVDTTGTGDAELDAIMADLE